LNAALHEKWGSEGFLWATLLVGSNFNVEKALGIMGNVKNGWSVVSALLMTIGFAGMLLSPDTFNIDEGDDDIIRYVLPLFYCLCGCSALVCVIESSLDYKKANICPRYSEAYILLVKHFVLERNTSAKLWMYISVASLFVAVPLTTYVLYDDKGIAGMIAAVCFIALCVAVKRFMVMNFVVVPKLCHVARERHQGGLVLL
jgi:hypothetical protein